jgi:hypothetical protein
VLDKNRALITGISPAYDAGKTYYTATSANATLNKIVFSGIRAGLGYQVKVINSSGCESGVNICGTPSANRMQAAPTSSKAPASNDIAKRSKITAYPIPFFDKATLEFKSAKDEDYVINLYNLEGRMVRQLKAGKAKAGEITRVEVDGKGMAETMYLARKESKSGVSTIKLLKKR